MVTLMSLWLPVLLAAVLVFVASSIIHTVLTYHRSDYGKVPQEDDVMAAMRAAGMTPGEYMMPHCTTHKEMQAPEFAAKVEQGPVAVVTVMPGDQITHMGKTLVQWFLFCLLVSLVAAYISGRTLAPGTEYLQVFRVAGCTAFLGYALALWQHAIWFHRKWSTTIKYTLDGLLYGMLTGGAFGWLWPG